MPVDRRQRLSDQLLALVRADARVVGAALVGSAAAATTDSWSDVDLFLAVADGAAPQDVLDGLSAHLYRDHGALHHFDIAAGTAIYRAFLLAGLVEVDLGVTSVEDFRSRGEAPFVVLFGEARPSSQPGALDSDHLAGLVWHHALHARSSIERQRPWQAEHWISAIRDHVLTLAAHRYGEPTAYAKGADALPASQTAPLELGLVRSLDLTEVERALRHVLGVAIQELHRHDPVVARRLEPPLQQLAGLARGQLRSGSVG